jgi:hypothetical protein
MPPPPLFPVTISAAHSFLPQFVSARGSSPYITPQLTGTMLGRRQPPSVAHRGQHSTMPPATIYISLRTTLCCAASHRLQLTEDDTPSRCLFFRPTNNRLHFPQVTRHVPRVLLVLSQPLPLHLGPQATGGSRATMRAGARLPAMPPGRFSSVDWATSTAFGLPGVVGHPRARSASLGQGVFLDHRVLFVNSCM